MVTSRIEKELVAAAITVAGTQTKAVSKGLGMLVSSESSIDYKQKSLELEGYLNEINSIMCNTWMVKDRKFTFEDGTEIMDVLSRWAAKN